MRIVKKYWLPLLALVLAIGLAVWRIGSPFCRASLLPISMLSDVFVRSR